MNILVNGNKMKVCDEVSSKLMKLNVDYNFVLTKVKINLLMLVKKLKSLNFMVLMSLKVSKGEEPKLEGGNPLIVFWIHSIIF
jgi:hypothetical protein